jgi:hypothetical protein
MAPEDQLVRTDEGAHEWRLKRWTAPAGVAVIRPQAGTGFHQSPNPHEGI